MAVLDDRLPEPVEELLFQLYIRSRVPLSPAYTMKTPRKRYECFGMVSPTLINCPAHQNITKVAFTAAGSHSES